MTDEPNPATGPGRAAGTLRTGGPAVLRKFAPALGTLALAAVAGCAGAAPPPFPAARVQIAPIPYKVGTSAVTIAVARREAASAADTSCDPTASLRPAGPPRVIPRSFMAKIRANGHWAASYARWIGAPAPAPPKARYR